MSRKLLLLCFLFLWVLQGVAQQSGPAAQHPQVQKLINANKVFGMPASGTLPGELAALQYVFTMADAPFELIKVYRYGSPAGKLYALMGLKALNSQHFAVFKNDFTRKPQGTVSVLLEGNPEASRDAIQFLRQWETDFDSGSPYTRVKP